MQRELSIIGKLVNGGLWAIAGKFSTAVLTLAIGGFAARLLGPEDVGSYFLAFSFVTFAALVIQLGISQTTLRIIAESVSQNRFGRIRRTIALAMKIVAFNGLLFGFVTSLFFSLWLFRVGLDSENIVIVAGIVGFWSAILGFQQLIAAVFRGFHDIKRATLFGGVLASVLTVVMLVVVWVRGIGINFVDIVIISFISALCSFLFSLSALSKTHNELGKEPFEHVKISELLCVALPILVTNLMSYVLMHVDVWLVGYILGAHHVAGYAAAVRLASQILLTTTILSAALPALIVEMYGRNELKNLERILRACSFANSLAILPLVSLYVIAPKAVLSFIYGEFYEDSSGILVLLTCGAYFNVITGMRGLVLMMSGGEKHLMLVSLIGVFLNVVFVVLGVLKFGVIGAAAGAMIGMIAQCSMELLFTRKLVGVWTYASLSCAISLLREMFSRIPKRV